MPLDGHFGFWQRLRFYIRFTFRENRRTYSAEFTPMWYPMTKYTGAQLVTGQRAGATGQLR